MSSPKEPPSSIASGKGAAPGQYLGFSLQSVRLCARLLHCSEQDSASTEHLDDVATRKADGRVLLEQNKSALSQNPVSDWATDLWKTFANWAETTEQSRLDPATTEYVIYVCPAKSGERVENLSAARSAQEVAAAIAGLQADLDASDPPPACADDILRFLAADEAIRTGIVRNFSLIGADDDPVDEIRDQVGKFVPKPVVDDVCRAAIGWVSTKVDDLLRDREIAEIEAGAFHAQLRSIIQRYARDELLVSVTPRPDLATVKGEMTSRTYIRQLNAIELDSDQKIRAAQDYIRATADRTDWSDRGLVHEASLDEFDDSLARRWSLRSAAVAIRDKQLSEIERGQALYVETMDHKERLQNKDVPPHFTAGAYHALADRKEVGWHPRFREVLPLDEENNDA